MSLGVAVAAKDVRADAVSAMRILEELEDIGRRLSEDSANEELRAEYSVRSDNFRALGVQAQEAILSRLGDLHNPAFRRELAFLLGEIPGEESDKALIRLLCFDPSAEVRSTTIFQLLHRIDLYGPFSFPVPEDEIKVLGDTIRESDPGVAAVLARILGACIKNGQESTFEHILSRYRDMVFFEGPFPKVKDSYVSPRVHLLNGFLLAFKNMGERAFEPLQHARATALAADEVEFAKWLCIASGFAGDPAAAPCTEQIVRTEHDVYVRCVAIRAYGWSAGKSAIPLLESLSEDQTVSEYSTGFSKYRIIGDTAGGMLRRLQAE